MTEVETCHGMVRGTESAGIRIFRGMRYAAPPSGENRFLPPKPVEPWIGVRECIKPGPAAPQLAMPVFGWISAAGTETGEDCLSLNVWTPGTDTAKRPVLVWIHGGGFLVGAGSTGVYDGTNLARGGDVVVVSINYRLGALGYAHLSTVLGAGFEESSNLGVRDQIAALEWVRDNIERFGGDPANVTVCGQSAGAMSVAVLLGAPRARKLFSKAICMSGAADHVIEPEMAGKVARTFLAKLGKPRRHSRKALADLSVDQILRAQHETMLHVVNPQQLMIFLPTVDGDVIPRQPLDAVRSGATADIPLMLGTTLDEWRLFRFLETGPLGIKEAGLIERFEEVLSEGLPHAPDAPSAIRDFRAALKARGARTGPTDVWLEFQSARMFHYPASRLAEAQHAAGGSAHSYLFNWRPTAMRRALGAFHALDIPFVFGSVRHPLARPLTGFTASARQLSSKMQEAWIGFTREGDPDNDLLPGWKRYGPGLRQTMIFGRRCSLASVPLEAERSLIESWSGHQLHQLQEVLPPRRPRRRSAARRRNGASARA